MPNRLPHLTRFTLVAAALIAAPAALAQTGPALLLTPWTNLDQQGQLVVSGSTQDATTDGGFDADALTIIEVSGRYRFVSDEPFETAIGVSNTYLDIDLPALGTTDAFFDQSIGVGGTLGSYEDWDLAGTLTVGSASDDLWSDNDGVYFGASLLARRDLNARSSLLVGLSYDGNRTFLPDVPLPSITWQRRESDQLVYSLGLPLSTLLWRPDDRWMIRTAIVLPYNATIRVEYELMDEELWLFGDLSSRTDAFHVDGDDEDRRIFFEQSRAELGIKYRPVPWAQIEAAAGYAFSGEFSRGWDLRDPNTLAELEDEPYLRLGVGIGF
jgi:hypothetical protein